MLPLRAKALLPDVFVAALLAAGAALAVTLAYGRLQPAILYGHSFDFWFESDIPAVYDQMVDRWAYMHVRNQRHALFSLIAFPLPFLLRTLFHVSAEGSVAAMLATLAAVWVAGLYTLLRAARLARFDAVVFTFLAAGSSASVFWFTVPETHAFGALTVLAGLGAAAWADRRGGTLPFWACVVASAVTASVTTTNWMVGLGLLVLVLTVRRAFVAAVVSGSLVFLGAMLQARLFPYSRLPFAASGQDGDYLFHPLGGGAVARLSAFFSHSLVMPPMEHGVGDYLTVQNASPFSGGWLTTSAVVVWGALLVLGAVAAVDRRWTKTQSLVFMVLGGQLALGVAFGQETFLYCINYAPLLVIFVALHTRIATRVPALVLAGILTVLAGANNVSRFIDATDRVEAWDADWNHFTARVAVLTEPEELVVYATHPALADANFAPPPAIGAPERLEGLDRDVWAGLQPDESHGVERTGWTEMFDHLSHERIEQLRAAGAVVFATNHRHALETNDPILQLLAEAYTELERTDDWAFYRLDRPHGSRD
jgi:hypothetical protein